MRSFLRRTATPEMDSCGFPCEARVRSSWRSPEVPSDPLEVFGGDLPARIALLRDSARGSVRAALGKHDPEDQVDRDAEPAEEDGQAPSQPRERRVDAEPLAVRSRGLRRRSPGRFPIS